MARIRTIKPEFWTDIKVVRLRFETRLFFIGMWNFADDEGYLPHEPDQLAMQIFPADEINAPALIDELIASDLVEVVDRSDGESFLRIANFRKHQKISHPQPSAIAGTFREHSGNVPGTVQSTPTKRRSIPNAVRRQLAQKYGAAPGKWVEASCYYCGEKGQIGWPLTSKGTPGFWVVFTLEIDHFRPLSEGGKDVCDNLALACRLCNRGRRKKEIISSIHGTGQEHSGNVPGTGQEHSPLMGIELSGIELKEQTSASADVSTEPEQSSDSVATAEASGFSFVTAGGKLWTLPTTTLRRYQATFPAMDVETELRKAALWLDSDVGRRKTPNGMTRFLTGWLNRANNSGKYQRSGKLVAVPEDF